MVAKKDQPKNRVYVECSETTRRVKAIVIDYSEREILVELPTGFRMSMIKKRRRSPYIWRIGMLEFLSDGKLIN